MLSDAGGPEQKVNVLIKKKIRGNPFDESSSWKQVLIYEKGIDGILHYPKSRTAKLTWDDPANK